MDGNGIFVYGFGNSGRQDDGLGPAIIKRLEDEKIQGIETDCNYQLNIEDADNNSKCKVVIFVDASIDADEPFSFRKIVPAAEITFTTHSMAPESVVALCMDIYNRAPEAYVMGIRGYQWDFEEGLTSKAMYNFNEAYQFLLGKITELRKKN